jgi:hypothetical protein
MTTRAKTQNKKKLKVRKHWSNKTREKSGTMLGVIPAPRAKCPVCDGIGEHKWNCTLNK